MKIYLAIPYTGNEENSFVVANQTAADLMLSGNIVYSPISHSHPIAKQERLPTDWVYWEKYDKSFIEWCDELFVKRFGDWRNSKGVKAEIEIAKKLNKPVRYI